MKWSAEILLSLQTKSVDSLSIHLASGCLKMSVFLGGLFVGDKDLHLFSLLIGAPASPENPIAQTALAALSARTGGTAKTVQKGQLLMEEALDKALEVPDFNAQLNPVLKQAVAAVMAADSYEEADAALTALYPKLDNRALQDYLAQALFLSDLLGQHDAGKN